MVQSKIFKVGNKQLVAKIKLEDSSGFYSGSVFDLSISSDKEIGTIYLSGNGVEVKNLLKKDLQALGVEFREETRAPRKAKNG